MGLALKRSHGQRHRLLVGALRAAYRDLIARDRHPIAALFVEVPAGEVDINVHPAKTEVRVYDYVDREVPVLLRMFEKRLPTYRAIGYARGEAPLGFAEPAEERTIEYDDEALRHFEHDV